MYRTTVRYIVTNLADTEWCEIDLTYTESKKNKNCLPAACI
jgi:hypothetical protein